MHATDIERRPTASPPPSPGAPRPRGRLRVTVITSHWGPPWAEGVRNLARHLVDSLQARGSEVTVVSPRLRSRAAGAGPLAACASVFRSLVFAVTAAWEARRAGADVILMMVSASPALGLRSWLVHRATGRPVVLYVTGRRSRIVGYRTLLRARAVLVNTPALVPLFPGAETVPPFTDPGRWAAPPRSAPPQPPVILFLGAFERCRGVEYLIEAMEHLPPRLGASLVLAWNGRGWRRAGVILQAIRASRAAGRISLVRGGDVAAFYAEAAVTVIPRITPERMAFPLRIVEAVSMATPLVVTTVNGMDRIVEGCGLAVPPRDARALAAALERLLTDADLYRSLVAGCQAKSRLFDSARSLETLYQTLTRHAA